MPEYNWGQLLQEADAGVQPIPAGEYEAQCGSAVLKQTANGKDMIQARYNIVNGPAVGRPVWNNFVLSPENSQSMGFFFRHMKSHGLDDGFFKANPSPTQVAENLVGKMVHIVVKLEERNGEQRNTLSNFTPSQLPGGAAPAVAAPAPLGVAPAAAPLAPPLNAIVATPVSSPLAPPAMPVAAAPLAPPVAPAAPVVAPAPAPVAPPAPARQFDPTTGMEVINGAWAWPQEQALGYTWNGQAWLPAAPAAPLAPPMPPAPPAPSF